MLLEVENLFRAYPWCRISKRLISETPDRAVINVIIN